MFTDNTIRLELPFKYPETIRVMFIPDIPGPLTIEIVPSTCTIMKSPDMPKEKPLPQNLRTFIGPGIDNSPVKPSTPTKPIGNAIFHPPTSHIADFATPDDSVMEPESEVEQGVVDAADKTIMNMNTGIKCPGSPLILNKFRTTRY
ncbi:hypothetical protein CY34DRAFT_14447 [Suillus luteus UH-Slu-Lm8-n1]|uniref:Uncharacterized protein n=1 Tax=Suillus luteus UH-Slu-Lm8-n1 TaxID=930992 RepID=A0A0D0AC63_9AGAM|nr:hypothetical protein CY34DRAFT_14447 [Suillus luteus UH-Slu-Lm8-n1]